MLEQAAVKNPTVTLDDLRRDVRLGMGPCQGGFCTYRAVGILHELQLADERAAQPVHGPDEAADRTPLWDVAHLQSPSHNQGHIQGDGQGGHGAAALRPPGASPALLLRDFLQERWRGLTPILWGQQLKQERLDELIYLSLMNADHLPDAGDASPMSEFWAFDTTPDSGPDSGPGSGAEGAGRAQKAPGAVAPGAVAPGAVGAERQAGQVQP
jgi:glycerol-3-phosphate dehydrogenase